MALFEEVKKQDKFYKCDACSKTFPSCDVELSDAVDNIKILTPIMPFVYIDRDGIIMGGSEQPSKEKGDKLLTCPFCKAPHLFGF